LRCSRCFNPATHPAEGGESIAVSDLLRAITVVRQPLEGITVTGGEPLEQRGPVLALLRGVRAETGHSIILFTGYTWEQFRAMPEAGPLASCLDLLIAGPYDALRPSKRGLRGSENQTVHFLTGRYSADDLQAVPEAEIIIAEDGTLLHSGIDPVA
jgi:anaerobic ribonucleoside-triphosphate reductase activating protein